MTRIGWILKDFCDCVRRRRIQKIKSIFSYPSDPLNLPTGRQVRVIRVLFSPNEFCPPKEEKNQIHVFLSIKIRVIRVLFSPNEFCPPKEEAKNQIHVFLSIKIRVIRVLFSPNEFCPPKEEAKNQIHVFLSIKSVKLAYRQAGLCHPCSIFSKGVLRETAIVA